MSQHHAQSTPDGTLGAWTTSTSLPSAVAYSQAIVTKNRVYLLGGVNSTYSSAVYTAPINLDGTLGAWTTSTSLPGTVGYSQAIVTKNRVYLLGGYINSSYSSTVYTAPITGGLNDYSKLYDGTVNKFDGSNTTGTITLQGDFSENYLTPGAGRPWEQQYMTGATQSGNLTGTVNATGFPVAISGAQALVTKNKAYILGGKSGSVNLDTIYSSTVNADGSLVGWVDAATYVNTNVSGSGSMTILAGAKSVRVTARGADGSTTSTPATITLSATSGSGSIPAGVSSLSVTGKGGDGSVEIGTMGSGTPWKNLYNFNSTGPGDTLGAWTTSTYLPSGVYAPQAIVTKNRVYLLGGRINGAFSSTVYTAPINLDGTLGAWTTSTYLPRGVYDSQAIVTKNRVYLLGGVSSSTVYTAPINLDGTLGAWTTSTSLPDTVTDSQAIVTKNRVYLLGGYINGSSSSTVYTAPINCGLNDYSDIYAGSYITGNPTTFTANGNTLTFPGGVGVPATTTTQTMSGLPNASLAYSYSKTGDNATASLSYIQVSNVVGANSTYTLNGNTLTFPGGNGGPATTSTQYITMTAGVAKSATYNMVSGVVANVTYTDYTTSLANGTVLPAKLTNSNIAVTKNRVYMIAGNQDSSVASTVYTASINLDGSLAGWTQASSLPSNANPELSSVAITRDTIYVMGGKAVGTGALSSTIYYAPIDANGNIGTWTTSTNLPSSFYAGACFTTYNRIYLLGGYVSGSTSTTIYTATINPDGSLGTWSTTTPLPTHTAYGKVYVSKNTVYVFGANNTTTMYYTDIAADGTLGGWNTGTATGYAPVNSAIFSTNGKLYLVGGAAGNGSSTNVATYSIGNTLNDYSAYYNGSIVAISPSSFRLPDFTAKETNGINFYIKY